MRVSSAPNQRVLTPTSSMPVSASCMHHRTLVRGNSNPQLLRMSSASQLLSNSPRAWAPWVDQPRKATVDGPIKCATPSFSKPHQTCAFPSPAAPSMTRYQDLCQTPSRLSSETTASRTTLASSMISGSAEMEQAISWASLSDFEMRDLAEKRLHGSVAPKILQRLSRRDIVSLLSTVDSPVPTRPMEPTTRVDINVSRSQPLLASNPPSKLEHETVKEKVMRKDKSSELDLEPTKQKVVRMKENNGEFRQQGFETNQTKDKMCRMTGAHSNLLMQLFKAEECAAKLRRKLQDFENDPEPTSQVRSQSQDANFAMADPTPTSCRSRVKSPTHKCPSRSASPPPLPEHPFMPWPPNSCETLGEKSQAYQVYGLSRSRSPSVKRSTSCTAIGSPSTKHVTFGGGLPEIQVQRSIGTAGCRSRYERSKANLSISSPRDSLV